MATNCDHPADALTGFTQSNRSDDGITLRFRAFCESCTEPVEVRAELVEVQRVHRE